MAPSTRTTKRRASSSNTSLASPVPAKEEPAATTTPVSGRKMTKQEAREEAKLRAAIAMGHGGTPSKKKSTPKKATTPKVKVEKPTSATPKRTPTKVNNPYFSPPTIIQPVAPAITSTNPAGSEPNQKVVLSNKKRGKEANNKDEPMPPTKKQPKKSTTDEAIAAAVTLVENMSLGDTATPEYDPVPKVLMEKLLQSDNEEDAYDGLIELWNELEMAIPKPSSNKIVREDVLDNVICSGVTSCIVVSVAQKWKTNEQIQYRCLECLVHLAKATASARASIVKFGGVESIVNAMENFPASSTDLINTGCRCLLMLSVGCYIRSPFVNVNDKLTRVWHRFLHDMGGVQLLVKTMERNQESKAIQSNCINTFYNLATVKETRSVMEAAGVVEVVAAARKKHATDNKIMAASEDFMKTMFSN